MSQPESPDDEPVYSDSLQTIGNTKVGINRDATARSKGLVDYLLSISKSVRALTGLKLAELDYHSGQDELLIALDERQPLVVSALAEKLNVRPSTVSKMVDRLVDKGVVQKSAHGRDARRTIVSITSTGLDDRSLLIRMRGELEAELAAAYQGDLDNALQCLGGMADVLAKRLQRLR